MFHPNRLSNQHPSDSHVVKKSSYHDTDMNGSSSNHKLEMYYDYLDIDIDDEAKILDMPQIKGIGL